MINILEGKIYVIVSKWAYPFGGGEEFLYQTIEWAGNLKMKVYWICFSDAKNNNFIDLSIEHTENGGTIIKIPNGMNEGVLANWLSLLKPDIVHHQGHDRLSFYNACEKIRTEFLSGFHFWSGSIILDPIKKNSNIIENYKDHKIDPEFEYLYGRKYCNLYTVTPFVSECIQKITNKYIDENIYASSSYKTMKIDNINILNNKFVTMINIHKLKGGEIFLNLIKKCKDIPFLGIKTEYGSEDLDKIIEEEAIKRNKDDNNAQCVIMNRLSNPKTIYQQSRIVLVPTLVDETFCRVMNEAMMNGIPVLTTGYGNTKKLLKDSGFILNPDDIDLWKNTLLKLYFDNNLLKIQSDKTLKDYEIFSEKKSV